MAPYFPRLPEFVGLMRKVRELFVFYGDTVWWCILLPVFCPLASRYYDSVNGNIDTKQDPVPILSMPIAPAQPASIRAPKRQKPQQSQPSPQHLPPAIQHSLTGPQQSIQPPRPQPAPTNSNSRGFRNSRVFGLSSTTPTTTTTTSTTPRPPLVDYEYDYADYNDTGLANAASSIQIQTLQKISDQLNEEEKDDGSKMVSLKGDTRLSRRKRKSDLWMLNRRKGQLNETVTDNISVSTFACDAKITEVAYADVSTGCKKFFVCVTVAPNKRVAYHLDCDKDKRFNQILGMCDSNTDSNSCEQSLISSGLEPTRNTIWYHKYKLNWK